MSANLSKHVSLFHDLIDCKIFQIYKAALCLIVNLTIVKIQPLHFMDSHVADDDAASDNDDDGVENDGSRESTGRILLGEKYTS